MILKSFPKEIPKLSIVNYPLSIARQREKWQFVGGMKGCPGKRVGSLEKAKKKVADLFPRVDKCTSSMYY